MTAALLPCAVVGLCVGFPALRLGGHYVALVTLGFGEIVQLIATNWENLTGGPFGMHDYGTFTGLPSDPLAQRQDAYVLVAAIALAGLAIMLYLTRRTNAGPAFRALREDQILAGILRIHTTPSNPLAFPLPPAFPPLAAP